MAVRMWEEETHAKEAANQKRQREREVENERREREVEDERREREEENERREREVMETKKALACREEEVSEMIEVTRRRHQGVEEALKEVYPLFPIIYIIVTFVLF